MRKLYPSDIERVQAYFKKYGLTFKNVSFLEGPKIKYSCIKCGKVENRFITNFLARLTLSLCSSCNKDALEKESDEIQLINYKNVYSNEKYEIIDMFRKKVGYDVAYLCLDCGQFNSKTTQAVQDNVFERIECDVCKGQDIYDSVKKSLSDLKFNLINCDDFEIKRESKFRIECENGHPAEIQARYIIEGFEGNCDICEGKDIESKHKEFLLKVKRFGGKLAEKDTGWRKARGQYLVKCHNKRHKPFPIDYAHLVKRGHWCPDCGKSYVGQNLAKDIMEHLFQKPFDDKFPEWNISPISNRKMELDGYNEELKLAFEHTGDFREIDARGRWKQTNEEKEKFLIKWNEKVNNCKKQGVLLLEFFNLNQNSDLLSEAKDAYDTCVALGRKPKRSWRTYRMNPVKVFKDDEVVLQVKLLKLRLEFLKRTDGISFTKFLGNESIRSQIKYRNIHKMSIQEIERRLQTISSEY